jgi:hypothetical protein
VHRLVGESAAYSHSREGGIRGVASTSGEKG